MNVSYPPSKVLIVGAGLSGAVLARQLAQNGILVDIIEKRSNIAGNVFTKIDESSGNIKTHIRPTYFQYQ